MSINMQNPYQNQPIMQQPGAYTQSPGGYVQQPGAPQFMQPSLYQQPQGIPAVPSQLQAAPPVETNIDYMQAYLRTKIGQRVNIQFLIGTNIITDRTGTLLFVGIDYLVIEETDSDDHLLCDIYSVKFVRFYY